VSTHIESARRTFRIETDALTATLAKLDEQALSAACELLLACKGRIVVSGMGKSGHIARKIASTLTSTGTPSLFLHPAEAAHGDIGLLQSGDILIILSKSGESDELYPLLHGASERLVPIIAITSNLNSELAKAATNNGALLQVTVNEEACPHDLAPTASTTAQLVIGDALAIALLEARKFTSDDFARLHPGGALGRKLTMTVGDLMKSGSELPLINQDATLSSVMLEISGKRLGCVCVIDGTRSLLGIITDGDLRRCFQRDGEINVKDIKASDLMSRTPKSTTADTLAIEALQNMEDPLPKVMQLPVLDEKKIVIGLIHLHDIVKAGIQ
jgi:arabinose-5-phosphate isomerase